MKLKYNCISSVFFFDLTNLQPIAYVRKMFTVNLFNQGLSLTLKTVNHKLYLFQKQPKNQIINFC